MIGYRTPRKTPKSGARDQPLDRIACVAEMRPIAAPHTHVPCVSVCVLGTPASSAETDEPIQLPYREDSR